MKNAELYIYDVKPGDVTEVKKIETEGGLSVWKISDYLAEIERNDKIFKLIRRDRTTAGFILARLITNGDLAKNNHNTAEIYNIAVRKEFRRMNVGSALLNELFKECRERGVSEVWLELRESNFSAENFYKKHGFVKAAMRKNYYTNPSENAIVMKCVL